MKATPVSERIFMDQVRTIALMNGWLIDHTPTMQYSPGKYATGGLKGKADLLLIHPQGRGIIWAELKTERGKMTPEQMAFAQAVHNNGGEFHLWRPSQIELIAVRLGKR